MENLKNELCAALAAKLEKVGIRSTIEPFPYNPLLDMAYTRSFDTRPATISCMRDAGFNDLVKDVQYVEWNDVKSAVTLTGRF